MATTEWVTIFFKVVDACDKIKNKHYITNIMVEAIKK